MTDNNDDDNLPPPPSPFGSDDPSPVEPVQNEPVFTSPGVETGIETAGETNDFNDYGNSGEPAAAPYEEETQGEEEEGEDLELTRGGSTLSNGPGKIMAFGFIMLLVVAYILYSLFGGKPQAGNPNSVISAINPSNVEVGAPPSLAPPAPPPGGSNTAPIPAGTNDNGADNANRNGGNGVLLGPDGKPLSKEAAARANSIGIVGTDANGSLIGPDGKPVSKETAARANGLGIVGTDANGNAIGADGKPLNKETARPNGAPPLPPPPPPPPRAPGAPPPVDIKAFNPTTNDKEEQKRLRSNMLVLDSGANGNGEQDKQNAKDALNKGDPNKAFTSNVLKASGADKTTATRLSNLSTTIAQGKIVDAVMETAVNTDLPGTLRAIVSRDVYAESGREVMIPKGSRMIGTYNTGILRGQRRVLIIWTRLIRPDGLDIEIGSPGIDQLGRGGVEGIVDNKYSEIFSAALLTSVFNIGVAVATNDLISNQGVTTTTNGNGTTTTGTAAATSAAGAVTNLGNVSRDVVNTFLDVRPTITIDQGTRVNVFVNQDLIFPSALLGGPFIQ